MKDSKTKRVFTAVGEKYGCQCEDCTVLPNVMWQGNHFDLDYTGSLMLQSLGIKVWDQFVVSARKRRGLTAVSISISINASHDEDGTVFLCEEGLRACRIEPYDRTLWVGKIRKHGRRAK